jgi:hypothetical protein
VRARTKAKAKANVKDGMACRQENVMREGWRWRWRLYHRAAKAGVDEAVVVEQVEKWVALTVAGGIEGWVLRVKDKGSKNEECKGMG